MAVDLKELRRADEEWLGLFVGPMTHPQKQLLLQHFRDLRAERVTEIEQLRVEVQTLTGLCDEWEKQVGEQLGALTECRAALGELVAALPKCDGNYSTYCENLAEFLVEVCSDNTGMVIREDPACIEHRPNPKFTCSRPVPWIEPLRRAQELLRRGE